VSHFGTPDDARLPTGDGAVADGRLPTGDGAVADGRLPTGDGAVADGRLPTGDGAVDDALALLDAVADEPLDTQIDVGEQVHRVLQGRLSALGKE